MDKLIINILKGVFFLGQFFNQEKTIAVIKKTFHLMVVNKLHTLP